ncbi:MAG TPA: MBL fold metallo-hydrolase [Methylibium sp.]|uniref:MBL fold metallo-hydrolase n=1 Tax=Methylibium sp. TaxID=2067992 RepID=UPI002DBAF337|nr:MBL fold metallo-hydrolase [Methylibium sp.]HEU4458053.1 MBL fold metallo-hydrolase [Methylibium sp.]
MKLHHLNCISSCPLGGRLMDGRSASVFQRGRLCCHCALLETDRGLVLIDTGFGLDDVRQPRRRLSAFFLALLSPDFREEMTALRQIERLGFRAADVRHVVLTHLDFDHAGGLTDFPQARVHMLSAEHDAAVERRTWLDRQRYRPQQWGDRSRWHGYLSGAGEPWFGFSAVRALDGLDEELLLVPLVGHTLGHAGVAFRADGRWHLQAGDAYFDRREMDFEHPRCAPGLRMYQTLMEKDRGLRLANQQRLRQLKREQGANLSLMCSHDPMEFEAQAGRRVIDAVPAAARPVAGAA